MIEFWKKNRTLIISILGILLILNYCAQMWQPEDFYSDEAPNPVGAFWQILVILSLLGVLLYYGYIKGWYARFIPKWVLFTTLLSRDKVSKRLIMRITVANNTKESKTFLSPQIYFKKWQNLRKFNIKTAVFPLTLMPGTKQDLVIDIDQFWDRIPDLKEFKRVGAFIQEEGGRLYRTRPRSKWLVL